MEQRISASEEDNNNKKREVISPNFIQQQTPSYNGFSSGANLLYSIMDERFSAFAFPSKWCTSLNKYSSIRKEDSITTYFSNRK